MPLTLSKLVATKTGLKTDDIPRNNDTQLWIKLQTNQHKRCLFLRWFRRRTANEQSLMSHCLQSEASIEIGRGGQGRSPQHQLGFYFFFDWRRIQWKMLPGMPIAPAQEATAIFVSWKAFILNRGRGRKRRLGNVYLLWNSYIRNQYCWRRNVSPFLSHLVWREVIFTWLLAY